MISVLIPTEQFKNKDRVKLETMVLNELNRQYSYTPKKSWDSLVMAHFGLRYLGASPEIIVARTSDKRLLSFAKDADIRVYNLKL